MRLLSTEERDDLVARIAQEVLERLETRDQINQLADLVVSRVMAVEQPPAGHVADSPSRD
jgi:hypothetical protein